MLEKSFSENLISSCHVLQDRTGQDRTQDGENRLQDRTGQDRNFCPVRISDVHGREEVVKTEQREVVDKKCDLLCDVLYG